MTVTAERTTPTQPSPAGQQRWWRRPWVGPLGLAVTAFVLLFVPRYLSFDPAQSRVPSTFPLHYPFLVGHVLFGTVAMVTCCLQVWPRLRVAYPKVHRWSGRTYVAAALPAGVLALIVGAMTPFGPITAIGDVTQAVLWLGTTTAGFVYARRRNFVQHRRWMIRSFAMTMSIIVNRVIGIVVGMVLTPQLNTTFHGDEFALGQAIPAATMVLTVLFSIISAELWLERDQRKLTRSRRGARAAR
ncbi:DUF2306 domain-containing protein [Sciscionella sediminilitoris]|uniref:DUF2306 domain-containing protein n=1 Tax=Sciscionella sediminilitoris TaxID=1445613 RepID=UPI0004DF77BE|nr:DUF2306 domain-containing protein [Sciscionella sp. SE31]